MWLLGVRKFESASRIVSRKKLCERVGHILQSGAKILSFLNDDKPSDLAVYSFLESLFHRYVRSRVSCHFREQHFENLLRSVIGRAVKFVIAYLSLSEKFLSRSVDLVALESVSSCNCFSTSLSLTPVQSLGGTRSASQKRVGVDPLPQQFRVCDCFGRGFLDARSDVLLALLSPDPWIFRICIVRIGGGALVRYWLVRQTGLRRVWIIHALGWVGGLRLVRTLRCKALRLIQLLSVM